MTPKKFWFSRREKPEGGMGRLGTVCVLCYCTSRAAIANSLAEVCKGVKLAVFVGKGWATCSWAESRQFLIPAMEGLVGYNSTLTRPRQKNDKI